MVLTRAVACGGARDVKSSLLLLRYWDSGEHANEIVRPDMRLGQDVLERGGQQEDTGS